MTQVMAIFDHDGKRSEVIQENDVYTVNFYQGARWKHATDFKSYMEAVRVAEQYAQTGRPQLLVD